MPAEVSEDCYELSPMQQGMLYHSLESPDSGMYCVQVSYTLEGRLDPAAFARAWQRVVDRHPALRTSFHWKDRPVPYQRVHPWVKVPFEHHDWRGLEPDEQEGRLSAILDSTRCSFELDSPPLLRLRLIRTAEATFRLVLSHHHLLLDGWCKRILFDEVFAFYQAETTSVPAVLDDPRPYREFVEWLRGRDLSDAERFWRNELAGFARPTPVLPRSKAGDPETLTSGEVAVELDSAATARLRDYSRSNRLTLSTLALGAWGMVLGVGSGEDDVVFGATVSGRPTSLAGAETMVGLFINTLPVRLRLEAHSPTTQWLSALQVRQARSRDYDFTPLSQIQRWVPMLGGRRLFESIVVFENSPGFGRERERHGDIEIGEARATIRNSFPLTLRCLPAEKLSFHLLYDAHRFSRSAIEAAARQLVTLFQGFPRSGAMKVGDHLARLRETAAELESAQAAAYQRAVREQLQGLRGRRR